MFNRSSLNFLAAKMDHWSYEKEWWFMNMPDGAAQRGVVINGQELLLFDFESSSIREIVLGANCAAETVAAILEAVGAAGLELDLYQVKRSAGYGFERPHRAWRACRHRRRGRCGQGWRLTAFDWSCAPQANIRKRSYL